MLMSPSSHEGADAHPRSSRRERKRGRKPAASVIASPSKCSPAPLPGVEASSLAIPTPSLLPLPPSLAPLLLTPARSLSGSLGLEIAEPSGVPRPPTSPSLPGLPTALFGPPVQPRVASHRWSSDALVQPPTRPSQRELTLAEIRDLPTLEKGEPVPTGPKPPPAMASGSWHNPNPAPPRPSTPRLEVERKAEDGPLPRTASRPPPPLKILVLFSGSGESQSNLPQHLREAGCEVVAIDTKVGGASHDVLRASVRP